MSTTSRRSSLGMFLTRSKSGEMEKKINKAQAARALQHPPKLPEFSSNSEVLSTSFSPPDLRDNNNNDNMNGPPPQYEANSRQVVDSVAAFIRTQRAMPDRDFSSNDKKESMTNRGRYSYSSTATSFISGPRRVRRRKDPIPLNILVVGSRNAGKTSFLEFLKKALAPSGKKAFAQTDEETPHAPLPSSGGFAPHYLETEIDGERIGLTLWDSEGLEKNIADLQTRELSAFLESKFEETLAEEMKVVRSPGVQDTHIHATFLILDPSRLDRNIANAKRAAVNELQSANSAPRVLGALDQDLDVQVLETLQDKTTVIPIISKADTVTAKHMSVLKKSVWASLRAINLDPLEGLGLDEDSDHIEEEEEEEDELGGEDDIVRKGGSLNREAYAVRGLVISPPPTPSRGKRLSGNSFRMHRAQNELKEENKEEEMPLLPFSIISPDLYEPDIIGRKFIWGFADPYNEQHCDFLRLQEAVFCEWRTDLRLASREQWYERWRTSRLKARDSPYSRY